MSIGSAALAREADVTYRQLDTWTRNGLISSEQDAYGSGVHRTYSDSEARVATMLGRLVSIGFTPAKGAPIARILADGLAVEVGGFLVTMADNPAIERLRRKI
jgi:DNA-binding transcriptional MerR regulator